MVDVRNWKEIVETQDLEFIAKMTGDWRRSKGFESGWPNFAEKIILVMTEGDEAMEALDGMRAAHQFIAKPQFYGLGDACQKLMHYLENYVEEWVDVMIRLFDVMNACDLEFDSIDSYGSGVTPEPRSHGELVSELGIVRFTLLCRALSKAMECFRDVVFESNGTVPLDNDDNNKRVEDIGHWLSNAALIAAHAIEDVGVWWDRPYAQKMEANEKRPARHGRQR